jgi:GT2 family glycosyltransferase
MEKVFNDSLTEALNMNYAAFIITFNRPEILSETIDALCKQTLPPKYILIIDNGEKHIDTEVLKKKSIPCHLYITGNNLGPAGGAAIGLKTLAEQGFNWIQWIDDDDPPFDNQLAEKMFRFILAHPELNIGVIGPVGSFFNKKTGATVRPSNDLLLRNEYLLVDFIAGNMCMLIKREVALHIAPTPSLIFGFEELNFNHKVKKAGFQVVVPTALHIQSRKKAGRWHISKKELKKKVQVPWRRYYSVRNLVYMWLYDFNQPKVAYIIAGRAMLSSLIKFQYAGLRGGFILLYYTILGIIHGACKRMGLRVKPLSK